MNINSGLYQEGTYLFDNVNTDICLKKHGESSITVYKLDTTKSHQINITRFDLDSTIISGEFEFTYVNDAL